MSFHIVGVGNEGAVSALAKILPTWESVVLALQDLTEGIFDENKSENEGKPLYLHLDRRSGYATVSYNREAFKDDDEITIYITTVITPENAVEGIE